MTKASKSLSKTSSKKNDSDLNTTTEISGYRILGRTYKQWIDAVIYFINLRGFWFAMKYILIYIASILFSPLWSYRYLTKYNTDALSKNKFVFTSSKHKEFQYFHHPYNDTWANERRIEIPLIEYYMKGFDPKKTLEVGNVMSHYIKAKHDIVDKYEYDPKIINEDIMDYKPKKKYDLIISISTLEHVGIEIEKNPTKASKAIIYLKSFLTPKGKIVFTIPVGYNKKLDETIKRRPSLFSELYYFKRVTGDGRWIEVDNKDVFNATYGFPYRWGNTIILGIIQNN